MYKISMTRKTVSSSNRRSNFHSLIRTAAALATIFAITAFAVGRGASSVAAAPANAGSSLSVISVSDGFYHLLSFFGFAGKGDGGHVRPQASPLVDPEKGGVESAAAASLIKAVSCTPTGVTLNVPGSYPTIQAAINAASPSGGDKIQVAAGTFVGQFVVNKCVTIQGAGVGQTFIKSPGALTPSGIVGTDSLFSIVEVRSNSYVTMSDLTVTGPVPFMAPTGPDATRTYGIFIAENSTLDLSNAKVTTIWKSSGVDGIQDGTGIGVGRQLFNLNGELKTNNVTIENYQKNGITVDRLASSATLNNTTVTGIGPTTIIAQNGIQIGRGATGMINNSASNGNQWTADPTAATGVLVFDTASISVTNSSFDGNDVGVYHFTTVVPGTLGTLNIDSNTFSNNADAGIYFDAITATITNNFFSGNNLGIGGFPVNGEVSTIRSNSITAGVGSSAGIYLDDYSGSVTTATVNANFNRISGNAAGFQNDTASGPFDVTNNFWGCNTGPGGLGCDTAIGSATSSPYLILSNTNTSPANVATGGTSTVTTSLRFNSAAQDTFTFAGNPHLPNAITSTPGGIPVGFNASAFGGISPNPAALSNGQATSTFTGGGPFVCDQTSVVTASVNNATSSTNIIVEDTIAPFVTSISRDSVTPTNASSVTFTVNFSEAVTGVDSADFALAATGVTGASVTGLTGSGTTYTVTVGTGSGDGTIGLNVADDDSITDCSANPLGGVGAANGNFTGEVYSVDKSAPTVTINQAAGQADPTSTGPINFTVTFSGGPFIGTLDTSDLNVSSTGTGTLSAAITGGNPFNVAVSGMTGPGVVTASVNAGAVSDAANNPSSASTSTDNSVNYTTGATTLVVDVDGLGSATDCNDAGTTAYSTIQSAVDAASSGNTIRVCPGTYNEDINLNKTLTVIGVGGSASTNITGPIGGPGSTVAIGASGIDISGFTITRAGNNTTDWNNPGLNSAGISIQGVAITGSVIHDNNFVGNRTGIDINNSNGHTIRNNVINDNRTGVIFRNQTDDMTVVENSISNNWTVGILFLDGSGGTNSPIQSALNSAFINNNMSGNWYGQIVDRQSGGSIPAPGTNLKNFQGNWYGTTTPVITTANSTEPGYAAQIPVAYGGSASAPAGQPDIAGPASANLRVGEWLTSGTDTSGTSGFQGGPITVSTLGTGAPASRGWFFFAEGPGGSSSSGQFENGPTGGPIGGGSARLSVDANGRESLGTFDYGDIRLDRITRLKYSSWQHSSNAAVAPSLSFDYKSYLPGAAGYEGRLTFEPYVSNTVLQDQWQNWDALAGKWWASGGSGRPLEAICPQSAPCTWAQILAATSNKITIRPTSLGGTLLFRMGGPVGASATGYVDGFEIGVMTGNSTYDFEGVGGVAPSVTINQAATQADPTNVSPVNFTVTFSEPVTGFTSGDVTVGGSSGASGAGQVVAEIAPFDGTTYNVAVSDMSTNGTVIATVAAGAANDLVGNPNTASTSTDNLVSYFTGALSFVVDADGQGTPFDCNDTNPTFNTIQSAAAAASAGATIRVCPGTYSAVPTIVLDKANLTLTAATATKPVVQTNSSTFNGVEVTAPGVTIRNMEFVKTDLGGEHRFIEIRSNNFTAQGNYLHGPAWATTGTVRTFVTYAGVTGLLIDGNTIENNRQAAYFSAGTVGTVSNNVVTATKGWVNEWSMITFTGNTFGYTCPGCDTDIALLNDGSPGSPYQIFYSPANVLAISQNNDNAHIDVQFTPAADSGRAVTFVNVAATPNGDGRTLAQAYQTVQTGANNTLIGGIENVAGGLYKENVAVNRSISVLGPNAAIDPNTGTRVTEAVVVPAVTETSVQSSTSGAIFRVGQPSGHIDVTIKGLTIDGHNPSLASGRTLNGVEVHTGAGITNSIGSFDTNPGGFDTTLVVQNNIIRNLERYGVLADGLAPAAAMAGTNVSFNKIDNLPSGNTFGGERGRGIAFEENHYGTAQGNVITRVNVGWQDDNFYLPSPGSGTVVSNNVIHAYHRGIFHNLQYSNATNATISGNTLSAEPSGATSTNFGIELASINSAVGVTVQNNNISNQVYGYLLWNLPTTTPIVISGGTLSGNQYGVYATSYDPQFLGGGASVNTAVTGLTVTNSFVAGIAVNDSPATAATRLAVDNSTISGGPTGISTIGGNAGVGVTGSVIRNTTAAGIALASAGVSTATCNSIYGNAVGISAGPTVTSLNFSQNNIVGNGTGFTADPAAVFTANGNYWGSTSGPRPVGTGDLFQPEPLPTFSMTALGCAPAIAYPTVTINQAAGQIDPTTTGPIHFTVVFSESVTGFGPGDVKLSGTAAGTSVGTVTGSGTTYDVAVNITASPGTVIAEVYSGAALNGTNIPSVASTSTDNTVTIRATSSVAVNCGPGSPPHYTYTGSSLNPCTATYTTSDGQTGPATVTYSPDDINAGPVVATGTYPGDALHIGSSNTANFVIDKATATVVVTPYNVIYDAAAHSATVTSITGVGGQTGATVGSVSLVTTHTNAGTYASDSWTFTGTANYNNIGPITITDVINKATPTCTVTGYTVTYDGNPHTATSGGCTGVLGESVSGSFDLSGTTHTNPGTTTDPWTFTSTNPNYANTSGTVVDTINFCPAISLPTGLQYQGGGFPIQIPINTTIVTAGNLTSATFTFTYDPSVLAGDPDINGDIVLPGAGVGFTNPSIVTNSSTPGTLLVTISDTQPFTGSGEFLKVRMKVIGTISSTTQINIPSFDWYTIGPPFGISCHNGGGSIAPGDITVISGTITGLIQYKMDINGPGPTPTPPPTTVTQPLANVTVTAAGPAPVPTPALTDAGGNYTMNGFGPGTYTLSAAHAPKTCGSTPGLNGIRANDATLISRTNVHLASMSPDQAEAADVSGLGPVNALDATLVARFIVCINTPGSQVGNWKLKPLFASVDTVNGGPHNYNALLMGDVTGDWLPGGAPRPELSRDPEAAARVSVPSVSASQGSVTTVPLRIDNLRGRNVDAYQFDITFDPNVVRPADIAADLSETMAQNMIIVSNSPEPGVLKVVVYGVLPANGDGVYANLKFLSVGSMGATSPITIQGFDYNDGSELAVTTNGQITVSAASNQATLSGRLLYGEGRGVRNAQVNITDSTGAVRSVVSGAAGGFQFTGLTLGETYTITVASRRFAFAPRTIVLTDNATSGVDMMGVIGSGRDTDR